MASVVINQQSYVELKQRIIQHIMTYERLSDIPQRASDARNLLRTLAHYEALAGIEPHDASALTSFIDRQERMLQRMYTEDGQYDAYLFLRSRQAHRAEKTEQVQDIQDYLLMTRLINRLRRLLGREEA